MKQFSGKMDEIIASKYESVVVAARLARKINSLRLASKEQVSPEEFLQIDKEKVTTVALRELLNDKVRYERRKPVEPKEGYDLT